MTGPRSLRFTVTGRTAEEMTETAYGAAVRFFDGAERDRIHLDFGDVTLDSEIKDAGGQLGQISSWEADVTAAYAPKPGGR